MSSKRKDVIIFDGQVFQSTAWDRGMGKYSLNLLSALCKDPLFRYKQINLLFAKKLKLDEEAKRIIKTLCPDVVFHFLDLKVPKVIPGEDIVPIQLANKEILTGYINGLNVRQPEFVILSLLIDQYVTVFPDNTKNILLFYDLIPLQYSDRYGHMWSYPNYLKRFKTLFEAHKILTISQTVADDLAVYTGMDSRLIKNIDGGAIDRSAIVPTPPKLELPENYILMPSGNDLRKNNYRAIQAFEEFRISSGNEDCVLVITSHFDEMTQLELSKLSKKVVFTGNVTEPELKWLYEHTQVVLFVTEYEGLGLPILEGVEAGKPIVCSNLTVFNEMSEEAFYYADQHNPSSIAFALGTAIDRIDFSNKRKLYPILKKKYTWENTARKTIDFLTKPNEQAVSKTDRPRLAVFCPDPDGYSAIGKVVMLSHHALSQYFDVDYYVEEGKSGNSFKRRGFLSSVANVYDSRYFTSADYSKYDAVIYHIGNSEYHVDSVKNALHLPGYLIVHDTKLKELFEDVLLRYAYMESGRVKAERVLNDLLRVEKTSYLTSLVNASLGVIVHSEYGLKAIEELSIANTSTKKLNLPVATPKLTKRKLNSRFSVGFAGIIHKAKGLSIIDEIIASPDFHNVDLYIFGVPLVEPGILEKLESYSNVKIEKSITDFEFETRLSEMDAIISYRPNYNGETSLTVVEALRHGVTPVVRAVGWFDELPSSIVEKVRAENEVLDVLKALMRDEDRLSAMKVRAKEYTQDNHRYIQYAEGIYRFTTEKNNTHDLTTNDQVNEAITQKKSKETVLEIIRADTE